jgi:hypothetical protein
VAHLGKLYNGCVRVREGVKRAVRGHRHTAVGCGIRDRTIGTMAACAPLESSEGRREIVRFVVFREFSAALPLDELQVFCDSIRAQFVFDRAARPTLHLTSDASKALVQNNVKVFCSPRLHADAHALRDIQRILGTASCHLLRVAANRWVFEKSAEGTDVLPPTAVPLRRTVPTTSDSIGASSSSMFELPGTRLGDRLVPVDAFEHNSNMRDCDLRMQRIEERLWLGPYVSLCDLEELKAQGITHAVNASQKISAVARRAGIAVLDIDVPDSDRAKMEPHLAATRQFITDALSQGGVVLVNCFAGISRSATIVIDFLMHRDGLDFKTARNRVKAQRMCIKPNAGFRSELERLHRSARSSAAAVVEPIPFPSLDDVEEGPWWDSLQQT